MKPKFKRFETATFFACPFCQQALFLAENSLKCKNKHSFDLAKLGYVNLAPQVKQSKAYDKSNFQNRQLILEAGFYQPILKKLLEILSSLPQHDNLLDIGCGEGYYARNLQAQLPAKRIYAFDLSKESIQLAAKSDHSLAVNWFVGDLAHIPIQDASMDVILDIFSPANYQEFQRVLRKNGLLIKVIPSSQHLQEIRSIVAEQLTNTNYSNHKIIEHFEEAFTITNSYDVAATFSLRENEKAALLHMTPLLFNIDIDKIDWSPLTDITIAAKILVGQQK
ncbi:methyltransferase domain-containing protein [Streptococcus sp. IsoGale021]|uniref:putative RNA methyltransferase n=1 Tax=Streptococcus TaxID=1301 RepID=UPI0020015BA4|nr:MULTISPECIES: methyltransferase domain-containing protein [Streptococcus]MCY7210039.1 methyltransferase domain-containing protein [Streptococcus anginosus]MCY7212536.1 methyltransferase domain-containing protein [Streptococcus anginosus]MCY7226883.1 methyltransferase domain-containing protein [Streptococcus anginosus]MDQ8694954.1 methyltransferase domain-containing protein [Streptococcus sp. IsoGale021]MDU5129224.1 methyltransferase domain-containing protein [Streptococcus anginosus]